MRTRWLTVRRVSGGSTVRLGPERVQVSRDGEDTDLVARGRHDPCVVPRAVPMVEAMVALVLADHLLQARPCEPNRVATMRAILVWEPEMRGACGRVVGP